MRNGSWLLVVACLWCAGTTAVRAQKQDCIPPPADSNVTAEQQKAAADGYRVACESVKRVEKRAAEPPPAAQADEYVPDPYFPPMRNHASLKDYMQWLSDEEYSCPNLVREAKAGLAGYRTEAGKVAFLKTIQGLVTKQRACE